MSCFYQIPRPKEPFFGLCELPAQYSLFWYNEKTKVGNTLSCCIVHVVPALDKALVDGFGPVNVTAKEMSNSEHSSKEGVGDERDDGWG